MKRIDAYLRPAMADLVVDALRQLPVHGLSLFQGRGFGRHVAGRTPHYLDAEVHLGFAELVKIEIVCSDESVPSVVECIQKTAHTGRHGDGKVFVSPIDTGRDIRTGKAGDDAL